jgi:hypothetical protein
MARLLECQACGAQQLWDADKRHMERVVWIEERLARAHAALRDVYHGMNRREWKEKHAQALCEAKEATEPPKEAKA